MCKDLSNLSFRCSCTAIEVGLRSKFWTEPSSTFIRFCIQAMNDLLNINNPYFKQIVSQIYEGHLESS